jgi:hypothetical protein
MLLRLKKEREREEEEEVRIDNKTVGMIQRSILVILYVS